MTDQDLFTGFGDSMSVSIQDWHVPGCAVTVVQNGRTVLCESRGLRDIERRLPFLTGTLFEIASLTKAFTAACLGTLVDRGLLAWDTPVHTCLPEFTLMDTDATAAVTVRDLISHQTGLPRHDGVWCGRPEMTGREIMQSLRWLEPSCKPHTRFQYQNMMYAVAGLVVEAVSGQTWQAFIQSELLEPLDMSRTRLSRKAGLVTGDYAMPYESLNDRVSRMGFEPVAVGLAPAGCLVSTAEDMGRWLTFQLGDGTVDGNRILAPETLQLLHTPVIAVTGDERSFVDLPEFGDDWYCLGWHSQSYRGHRMLHHSGLNDGLTSIALLFPDDSLGIAVLTNSHDTLQRVPLALDAADIALGLEPLPWNDRYMERARKSATAPFIVPPAADPGRPLSAYAGSYEHPAYGHLTISETPTGLHCVLHGPTAELIGSARDTFVAMNGDMLQPGDIVRFEVDASGSTAAVSAPLEPAVTPIRFVKE